MFGMCCDVLQIRCKDQLERRLKEIEDAKKIFSRSHVLVHV
jgi:hypothetical protein